MRRILPHTAAGRTPTRLILISMLALTSVFAVRSGYAVPLTVYGQLPTTEDVAISPNGLRLAYVHTQGDARIVLVANVTDHKIIRWVKAGDTKLRHIAWVDSDNLMIESSFTTKVNASKYEWSLLKIYNVPHNELLPLPGTPVGSKYLVPHLALGDIMVRHIAGHTDLFVRGVYGSPDIYSDGGFGLYRCDLNTKSTTLLATGEEAGWLVDNQGQVAVEVSYDEHAQLWEIATARKGWVSSDALSGHGPFDIPSILGFGPTTDTVLIQSIDHDRPLWRLLSTPDGKLSPVPQASEFNHVMLDPFTGRVIGGENLKDVPQYTFFDRTTEARWQTIVQAFAGDDVNYVSASSDFSKVVVLVQGPDVGYRYILVDLTKPAAIPIGNVYAGIDKPLAVRPIDYPAGDGLEIHAYLTLPSGRAAHDLALVVLPHGGPHLRTTAEFNWWSQALADQGYAVLQPNYRGSSGRLRLTEAGYGQLGRKMQTDLSDGVSYLVKQGIVDPDKACIVGGDYGGYAALVGVTLQPTVYRCAVSLDGISDPAKFLQWQSTIYVGRAIRYWDRYWGVSGSNDPTLDAISPIKHVDAVRAPVLLIHSRDDTVVPFEQSQIMFDALRSEHKDVQLVALKDEDHWLSQSDTRTQMLEATVDFLKAHNPPN